MQTTEAAAPPVGISPNVLEPYQSHESPITDYHGGDYLTKDVRTVALPETKSVEPANRLLGSTNPEASAIPLTDIRAPEALEAVNMPLAPEKARRRLGKEALRAVLNRAVVEGVGFGLDAALIAAGGPVSLLRPVAVREGIGAVADRALLQGLTPEEQKHAVRKNRIRKAAEFTVGLVVAGAAQKYSGDVAGHVAPFLNHGAVGEFVTPLAGKLGATTAVGAAAKRLK